VNGIETIFENSETGLWLGFAHSQASHCQETVGVIEGDEKCVTESAQLWKLCR
jgi:hypothetical protein